MLYMQPSEWISGKIALVEGPASQQLLRCLINYKMNIYECVIWYCIIEYILKDTKAENSIATVNKDNRLLIVKFETETYNRNYLVFTNAFI